jgi:CHAD domain-containing protein
MLWNEPGTKLGLDPEYLHDMRVAARRMRAALRLFMPALPAVEAEALRRELKWLGGALGRVRDLDVYLLNLEVEGPRLSHDAGPGMDAYLQHLRKQRSRARTGMLRALNAKRYAALVERLRRFALEATTLSPVGPLASTPVAAAARDMVNQKLKRVLRTGRDLTRKSSDVQLHRTRIRCKRLRYACEFFSDLFGRPARDFARTVKHLQDLLGAHQDAVVARQMLEGFAAANTRADDITREVQVAVSELMALHARQAKRSRKDFFKAWRKFDTRGTRERLKARMKRVAKG